MNRKATKATDVAIYSESREDAAEATRAQFRSGGVKAGADSKTVMMEMIGANATTNLQGEEQLPGKDIYFPTSDPKTWFSNIQTYSRVKYSGVYPGVDAAFYGNANRLEYDFMLQPKADPGQIRMSLAGADGASIDKDGSLVLRVGKGDIRFLVPVAYQTTPDEEPRSRCVSYRYKARWRAFGGEFFAGQL